MKRLTSLVLVAIAACSIGCNEVAPKGPETGNPVAITAKGQERKRCLSVATKNHKPCQQFISSERNNCYRHAITDSDVEYYEQVREARKMK